MYNYFKKLEWSPNRSEVELTSRSKNSAQRLPTERQRARDGHPVYGSSDHGCSCRRKGWIRRRPSEAIEDSESGNKQDLTRRTRFNVKIKVYFIVPYGPRLILNQEIETRRCNTKLLQPYITEALGCIPAMKSSDRITITKWNRASILMHAESRWKCRQAKLSCFAIQCQEHKLYLKDTYVFRGKRIGAKYG